MSQVPEVHVDWYLGTSPLPEIDERELAAAGQNPNGEVRYSDPNQPKFAPLGNLQLMGVRVVGPDGAFTGEEWRNPEFVPHPKTAGVEFANDFEVQLWRTLNGFLRLGSFVAALAEAEVHVGCDEHGVLGIVPSSGGEPTLSVYTSPDRMPIEQWARWMTLAGADVLEILGRDTSLGIRFNGADWPGPRMSTRDLLQLWRDRQAQVQDFMRTGPLPVAPTTMGTVAAPAGGDR